MTVHLVNHSEGRDLLINCLQKWTEPTWYSNALPKLDSEIFWAEPLESEYLMYTFSKNKATCTKCLEYFSIKNNMDT